LNAVILHRSFTVLDTANRFLGNQVNTCPKGIRWAPTGEKPKACPQVMG